MSSIDQDNPTSSSKAAIDLVTILSLLIVSAGGSFAISSISRLREGFDLSFTEIAAIFGLGGGLVAPCIALGMAFAADYFGSIRVLALTLIAASIGFVVGGLAPNSLGLLISTIIVGSCSTAALAIALSYLASRHGVRWLAVSVAGVYTMLRLGTTIVLSIDSSVALWPMAMYSIAGVATVCATILLILDPRRSGIRGTPRIEPLNVSLFWIWIVGFVLISATTVGLNRFSVPLMMNLGGGSLAEIAEYLEWGTLAGILGLATGGLSADYFARAHPRGYAQVALAATIVGSLTAMIVYFADSIVFVLMLRMLTIFCASAVVAPVIALGIRLSNKQLCAAGLAMIAFGGSLGTGIGPTIVKLIDDAMTTSPDSVSSLKIALSALSLLGIVASGAFYFVARKVDPTMVDKMPSKIEGDRGSYEKRAGDVIVREHVKDGFSWPAFFFGPLWAWSKGMVGIGFALLAGNIVMNGVVTVVAFASRDAGPLAGAVLYLALLIGWMIFIGASGNNWRRNHLEKKGYVSIVSKERII